MAAAAVRTPTSVPRTTTPEKPAAPAAAPSARVSAPAPRSSMIQAAPPAIRLGTGAPSSAPSNAPGLPGGGEPLPAGIQGAIEASLQVNVQAVRVHTDTQAQNVARSLSARAVTYGNDIFLGPGEQATDLDLIAHEIAHVVQQQGVPTPQRSAPGQSDVYEREAHQAAAAVVRRDPFAVHERTSGPRAQRFDLGLPNPLDFLADKANLIPGFRMFTIILGVNPINMSRVERSAANILRALVEFMPGGGLITQALDNHGVFDKVGAWVEQQIQSLGMVGSAIKQAVTTFIDSLGITDLANFDGVWERAKRIFTEPIDRIISFAKGLVTGIIKFIKDAILGPLAKLAEGTKGYDLLKAILGEDPITGDKVPRNAETLIGGFMKLIGQEEVWENIKKGNAVARAWAWFQGALEGLMGFVRAVPRKIIDTITSLTITDVVTVVSAFGKIVGAFVNIATDFISWGLKQVLSLLEILFDVLAPKVMPYIAKAKAAFHIILKDPIAFVGNLVRAAKLGFEMFASNILEHLKTALIKWITGPLGDAGVYIPKSFSLMEIVKLVLSVLGLTWQNIRTKLVKIIPEPVLAGLEKTAGILVTLVKDGPAAAWEQIKAELNELKDQMIAQVTQMITTEVVKAAVVKLVSMLNPAGAVVQAIIAIYNTVTFFIEKINQIAAVVASFIDSISAIASGQVANAAKKVEQTMANTLTVIIAFLAKFAGLGNIPNKVVGIIKKIRQPIDKGLDKIVGWLGNMLKKAGEAIFGKKDKDGKLGDVRQQAREALSTELKANHTMEQARTIVKQVHNRLKPQGLKRLEIGAENEEGTAPIIAEASPALPLAQLMRGVPKPKGRSVSVVAQLTLSVPVEVPATLLAPVDPIKATVPTGGAIWTPSTRRSTKLNVVTWNTSNVDPPGNSSHAEHQFVSWMKSRPELMSQVEKIMINNFRRSPCSVCGPELAALLTSIKEARIGRPVVAEIYWTELHSTGAQPTSWQSLDKMRSAGWSMHAPGTALPPEKDLYAEQVFVKLL